MKESWLEWWCAAGAGE